MRPFLIASVLYLFAASSIAQTNMRFTNDSLRTAAHIWSIQIQQFNASSQKVFLKAIIREKQAGEVYQAYSNDFLLEPGVLIVDYNTNLTVQESLNRLPNSKDLPNGNYWFHLLLFESGTNREIASVITKVTIVNNDRSNQFTPSVNQKHALSINGRLRTVYNFQEPVIANNFYPGQYVRTELQTQITCRGIPLELSGIHSTEKGRLFGPVNQFSVSIDKEAVKATALKLLSEKMSPDNLFDSTSAEQVSIYKNALLYKRYPQYETWKEKYDSLGLDKLVQSEHQLEAIESTLSNRQLTRKVEDFQNMKREYGLKADEDFRSLAGQIPDSVLQRLNSLSRLEQSYKNLEKQRDSLKTGAAKFAKYKHLYKKVKSAERPHSIEELAQKPDDIMKGLRQTGGLSTLQAILLSIDEFEIGTCYPNYSQLVIGGTRVKGGNVSITLPKRWHFGLFAGKKQDNIIIDTTALYINQPYYPQRLWGFQAGKGRPDDNYIYLQHIRTTEFGSSLLTLTTIPEIIKKQHENYVTGIKFQYADNKKIALFSGEVNQSLTNPDRISNNQDSRPYPVNFSQLFGGKIKTGAALDWGYSGNIKINLPNGLTRFSGLLHHVGPGYVSFGVPFIVQDITRYEIKANQDFPRKKLQLGVYYRRDFDQTSPVSKLNRTFTTAYGTQLRASLTNNVTCTFDYAPFAQTRDNAQPGHSFNRKGGLIMSTFQYRKKIQHTNLTSQATWISQRFNANDTLTLYRINSMLISNQISHSKYLLSIISQVSSRHNVRNIATQLYSLDASITLLKLLKGLNFTSGGQYVQETQTLKLNGIYGRASFFINRNSSFDFNLRYALIDRVQDKVKKEQILGWVALNVRW